MSTATWTWWSSSAPAPPFVQRGVDAVRHLRVELGPVDLFVYTPEEFRRMLGDQNPFLDRVLAEGLVVYEKADILEAVRTRVSAPADPG